MTGNDFAGQPVGTIATVNYAGYYVVYIKLGEDRWHDYKYLQDGSEIYKTDVRLTLSWVGHTVVFS